jgi:hypothetical protein
VTGRFLDAGERLEIYSKTVSGQRYTAARRSQHQSLDLALIVHLACRQVLPTDELEMEDLLWDVAVSL